jgi:NNP family nitrate/nitrite transporter-like MFS transporter
MIIFSTFVQMAEGATFAIVPFVNRRSLGSVAGIVGAGGPSGAVVAGFLFRSESMNTEQALLLIGIGVILVAPMVFLVRFSPQTEAVERSVMARALAGRTLAGRRLAEAPGAGD